MFRDGPIALAGECRAIDDRYYLKLIRELLDEFATAGILVGIDTALLARLLLGVLIEGSAILGDPERSRNTRTNLKVALLRLVLGLVTR
jgi:tetracycline repressor-like protein